MFSLNSNSQALWCFLNTPKVVSCCLRFDTFIVEKTLNDEYVTTDSKHHVFWPRSWKCVTAPTVFLFLLRGGGSRFDTLAIAIIRYSDNCTKYLPFSFQSLSHVCCVFFRLDIQRSHFTKFIFLKNTRKQKFAYDQRNWSSWSPTDVIRLNEVKCYEDF